MVAEALQVNDEEIVLTGKGGLDIFLRMIREAWAKGEIVTFGVKSKFVPIGKEVIYYTEEGNNGHKGEVPTL